MNYGTIKHCFILNTSVSSVLNKFMTKVAPPSDEINKSVFSLANQPKPLHWKYISLKYLHQFAQFLVLLNIMIIWTCPLRHFPQLLNIKWCNLAKDNNSLFSYYKQFKSDFLSFLLAESKYYKNWLHCIT